jgi:hypothetical protein
MAIKALMGKQSLLASAARTATPTAIDVINSPRHRGMILSVDSTAVTSTPSVTPTIGVIDGNGDVVAIWTAAAAISTATNTIYALYPAILNGNFTEVDGIMLPESFRMTFTHGNSDSITYSVVIHWLR